MLPTRTLTDWTPAQVSAAITSSDSGILSQASDLVQEIGRDALVRGVRSTRTLGMLGLPLSWEGPEPENWAKLAPAAELNRLLEWGLTLGVGVAQILPDGSLERSASALRNPQKRRRRCAQSACRAWNNARPRRRFTGLCQGA